MPNRTSVAPADGTLGALALWNAERQAGRRTVGQLDALSRAAMHDAAARDYTRETRACDRDAARAMRPSDRARLAACAAGFRRSAAYARRQAAAALLADERTGHAERTPARRVAA